MRWALAAVALCLCCALALSEDRAAKAKGARPPEATRLGPGDVLVVRGASPGLRVLAPSGRTGTTTFGGERFRVWGGWLCGPERGGVLYLGLLKPRNFAPTVTLPVPERRWFKRHQ